MPDILKLPVQSDKSFNITMGNRSSGLGKSPHRIHISVDKANKTPSNLNIKNQRKSSQPPDIYTSIPPINDRHTNKEFQFPSSVRVANSGSFLGRLNSH